jgi:hypothetical protein
LRIDLASGDWDRLLEQSTLGPAIKAFMCH